MFGLLLLCLQFAKTPNFVTKQQTFMTSLAVSMLATVNIEGYMMLATVDIEGYMMVGNKVQIEDILVVVPAGRQAAIPSFLCRKTTPCLSTPSRCHTSASQA